MQNSATLPPIKQSAETFEQRLSDGITAFCGKMLFVYVHIAIFGTWIATSGFGQDSFPFNFLTMAVSLEAIFLSTFILISQNRQQAQAEAHNDEVQERFRQMLRDVMTDEKLDIKNEQLLVKLVNRIDVERVRPIADQVTKIQECVARIEAHIAPDSKPS